MGCWLNGQFFVVELLEPKSLRRAKVFLIVSTIVLPPFKALIGDFEAFSPFGFKDQKIEIIADDSLCICYHNMLVFLLMMAPNI